MLELILIRMLPYLLFFLCCPLHVFAQSNSQIDTFIENAKVPTFDCPDDEFIGQIEDYLAGSELTNTQRLQLTVEKTHWQICMGKHDDAKALLLSLIDNPAAVKQADYYANALYQLGFIFDVQENLERCKYYQQAQELAQGQFDDVYLSAELGLITVCNQQNDEGFKLGKLYALLEQYILKNDRASIAHIHNNIGLLYGTLGQHVLAAEQFQKSYEMGLGTYKGTNQLATLISVISSQMASGDFPAARSTLEEFKQANQKINTPLTNVWLHFLEAGYFYRTENYDELRNSLARWEVFLPQINNATYNGLHRWYSSVICLVDKDTQCLRDFLTEEQKETDGYKAFVNRNKDYLKFQVDIYLFLGDLDNANKSFQKFADVMIKKVVDQQASGKVLGVANLHSQILTLESSLAEARDLRTRYTLSIVGALTIIIIILIVIARRKHLNRLAYDPVTDLYNAKTALHKIRQVAPPSSGRTNALALFDLGNFRDVNRILGSVNGDLALQQIAKTLTQVTRERDILGRFSPEQFIVCLTDIEEDSAKSFFERIRYALENTILGKQGSEKVSIRSSMSIYVTNETFDDLNDVINDMQMSLGKKNETSYE